MKHPVPIAAFAGILVCVCFFSLSSSAQNIDFGKSYINITKGLNGGTVEPGDTLEIRASFVVKSGAYDSCGYFDAVPAGTVYIPNTIRVLTNEGKIYKQFTDVAGDDEGWLAGTTIRINLGYESTDAPATAVRRGRIRNAYVSGTTGPYHKPSFFKSTCIQVASFRVRVTAAYNTNLSIGGGSMSYKPSAGVLTSFVFPGRTVAVYKNIGICPNAIGANSIGTESNGTFGSGKPRNRGTSPNVPTGYTYSTFTSGGPNDYFYGIANNTSINTGYTTVNTWPKPDNVHRVFGVWDIIGDHTGATNPLLGNSAADTVVKPNSGYMLVINAAYRIDSAFQQTISNLCPNTYYEISIWMRNICSKCGCDVNGIGAQNSGYIPTAAGDSSGVYPNLSFNVNGIDYYTTGNLTYTGQWVKKGFTFLTGPSQTSFTLKVFNNAPGGGGNDWALDDISVATCSPNLAFAPSDNPTVCQGNVVDMGAYVRSYFNNYIYFKWQKSTDNGVTWADAGTSGTGTPVWNGTAYEYYTAYPQFLASAADSGTKYRVVVASTLANISSAGCSFADVASVLTLHVIDCGVALETDFLSFSGLVKSSSVRLNWTTSREEAPVQFAVEKSTDGRNFSKVATIQGSRSTGQVNYYNWMDAAPTSDVYYRIRLMTSTRQKLSRIIKLSAGTEELSFGTIPNPFNDQLTTEVITHDAQVIHLQLVDNSGKVVRRQQFALVTGSNTLQLDTGSLPSGLYTVQLQSASKQLYRKVLKQ
jgi:hypothetical protein